MSNPYPWIKDSQYLTPSVTGYLAVTSTNGLYLTNGTLVTTITPTSVTSTTFNGALSGNATSATNIQGGLGGSIPYQTAVNTTALLANGTAGQVLTSQGTTLAPSWTTSSGGAGTLQSVLTAGNTATGATATIGLTNSGVGGLTNPSLTLTNSNATINTIPTIELNKTGRNLTAGENVASISMYGLDAGAQKTEFARIQVKTDAVASGNEDGTLSIYSSVNGAILESFNFNGGQNANNSFRPLDLNGNALKTSTTNLTIDATTSTGTGDITASAKGKVTLTAVSGSTTLPVNSLDLSSGNTITLTNGNEFNGLPENKIVMTSNTTGINNQIAMSVNDDGSSLYSRFFFGLQGSQFSICEAGGAGDGTNVWDIPANNTGNITMFRCLDFTFGSVSSGKVGVLEKSGINATTTGTLDITGNRFITTILTPTGALNADITTPMVVGQWWGVCNKSVVATITIRLNGVNQVVIPVRAGANVPGNTIRVAAASTTSLYTV